VCRTADVVCGKWTLLIIRDLAEGRSRFCELERSLQGISPRTLSIRLRGLEEEGVVARETFPEVPPRVEYALTEKGRALVPIIEDMRTYGRRWLAAERADAALTARWTAESCTHAREGDLAATGIACGGDRIVRREVKAVEAVGTRARSRQGSHVCLSDAPGVGRIDRSVRGYLRECQRTAGGAGPTLLIQAQPPLVPTARASADDPEAAPALRIAAVDHAVAVRNGGCGETSRGEHDCQRRGDIGVGQAITQPGRHSATSRRGSGRL